MWAGMGHSVPPSEFQVWGDYAWGEPAVGMRRDVIKRQLFPFQHLNILTVHLLIAPSLLTVPKAFLFLNG